MTKDKGERTTPTVLEIGGRTWTVEAVAESAVLIDRVQSDADLAAFPYGLLLWPASIALAERIAEEPRLAAGRRVLELGCGPGLPGMVARWRGGDVVQTDYQDAPLALARRNALENGMADIQFLQADWREFPPIPPFDLVIGSDILYERTLHSALHSLLAAVTAPGGMALLADPLRPHAVEFVDALERTGWIVDMDTKTIAWREERREIALFIARR